MPSNYMSGKMFADKLKKAVKINGVPFDASTDIDVGGNMNLSSAVNSTSGVSDGVAATPAAVKAAYDKGVEALNAANSKAAGTHNHAASEINTGTLAIARGGTNITSVAANRIMYASSTTALAQVAFPSGNGAFLRQNTSGTPYWTNAADVVSAIGAAANSHTHAEYAANSHTHSGYAASSHNHSASEINAGTLAIARGGTNITSVAANRIMYASSTTALAQVAFPSGNGAFLRQNTSGTPYWTNAADVVSAIGAAANSHTHAEYAANNHTHSGYAASSHTHTIANITNLQTTLDGKAAGSHSHSEYAANSHTHSGYVQSNATTLGLSATASSNGSIALGNSANAAGNRSAALGNSANALGVCSTALGYSANATTQDSIALGNYANASGYASIALGAEAHASGSTSVALGPYTAASNMYATALGTAANASGSFSIAIGYSATALNAESIAIGDGAAASENSTALGRYANASGYSSTALGQSANASGNYSTALGYSANVSNTEANYMQLGSQTQLSVLRCRVNISTTCDERDKADISPISNGLDFIKEVRPISFVSNYRINYIGDEKDLSERDLENKRKYGMCGYDKEAHAKGLKKGQRRRVGIGAQQVRDALIKVFGTADYANIVSDNFHDLENVPEDVENQYIVGASEFIPFLIHAVQELDAKVESLSKIVEELSYGKESA